MPNNEKKELAFVIVMIMPVFWPMARKFFFLDRHLNGYIMAFLLVLFGTMLNWHLVAMRHSVLLAMFLWNIMAFGYIDIMT